MRYFEITLTNSYIDVVDTEYVSAKNLKRAIIYAEYILNDYLERNEKLALKGVNRHYIDEVLQDYYDCGHYDIADISEDKAKEYNIVQLEGE